MKMSSNAPSRGHHSFYQSAKDKIFKKMLKNNFEGMISLFNNDDIDNSAKCSLIYQYFFICRRDTQGWESYVRKYKKHDRHQLNGMIDRKVQILIGIMIQL